MHNVLVNSAVAIAVVAGFTWWLVRTAGGGDSNG